MKASSLGEAMQSKNKTLTNHRLHKFVRFQRSRAARIRAMSYRDVSNKISSNLHALFYFPAYLRRVAFALDKISLRFFEDHYQERPEGGAINLEHKLERVKAGGPFEPYDVSLINKAAASLIGDAKRIIEVGCGTGMFASIIATANPTLTITASEFDKAALDWAKTNRAAPNIYYEPISLESCGGDDFDLAVAIEVIEHLTDYASFLEQLSRVAPTALITTPNKNRSAFDSIANTPAYEGHTREWTAGEFYWVLRVFWNNVKLFTLVNFAKQVQEYEFNAEMIPKITSCSVLSREEPLIAVCSDPRRKSAAVY